MSEPVTIRIGMTSARELEIEVEDGDGVVADIERAVGKGEQLFWITDHKGQRHGILVERLAFVEVEAPEGRAIGFAAGES